MIGPTLFYGGAERLWFSPSKWLWLREVDKVLTPLNGVTGTVKNLGSSEPLLKWAVRKAMEKLKKLLINGYVAPNGVIELFEHELDTVITSSKKADAEELQAAGDTGHTAHAWAETLVKALIAKDVGRVGEIIAKLPDDERAANASVAIVGWMAAHRVVFVASERPCYSRIHGFAGTLDGLAYVSSCDDPDCCPIPFERRFSLVDFKTSNALRVSYILQVAAYQQAHQEETGEVIEDRWILRLGKDDAAECEPWHIEGHFEEDFDGFLNALATVRSIKTIDDRLDKVKDARKIKALQIKLDAKEARMKIACEGFKKYKGIRPPRCNDGNPCESCTKLYLENQAKKLD